MPAVSSMAYFRASAMTSRMPAFVNVAHGEDVDAGFFDDFAFLGVEIASANDDDVAGFGFGLEAERSTSSGAP